MTRRHLLAWVVLIAVLDAGCGVRPTGVITGRPAPTGAVEGATLYFLANSSLTMVRRTTHQHLSPTQTLVLLQAGPNPDDRAERWDGASVHVFEGTYGEYLLNKIGKVFPELRQEVLEDRSPRCPCEPGVPTVQS